jgi:S-adenosylmethionine:tRNA ribosyltransferase-isomerase
MDSEQMLVTLDTANQVNKAHDENKNICAVGVTVMRALETVAGTEGKIKAYDGWTNKFIFPPYDFTVANSLITNFHLPYSTLIMLTAAFGDYDKVMNAYEVAIKEGYKFGVYGDAMLIL